ncbi:hypothetical protein PSPTOT1_1414 [Pseudomonas syringae pv. tomato T1]|nr:hypothetical protein PSPTOT1_1414 [Pseudomonas syringae pv. tomato T1]
MINLVKPYKARPDLSRPGSFHGGFFAFAAHSGSERHLLIGDYITFLWNRIHLEGHSSTASYL